MYNYKKKKFPYLWHSYGACVSRAIKQFPIPAAVSCTKKKAGNIPVCTSKEGRLITRLGLFSLVWSTAPPGLLCAHTVHRGVKSDPSPLVGLLQNLQP